VSFRVLATLVVSVLSALAVGGGVSLVALTSVLTGSVDRVAAAVESARSEEELEIALLSLDSAVHHLPQDEPAQRAIAASRRALEQHLGQLRPHNPTPEEEQLTAQVKASVAAYLAALPGTQGQALSPASSQALRERMDVAFAAMEKLVDLNYEQARAEQAEALRWNRMGDVLGFSIAATFAAAALGVLVWVWGFALRPMFELARSLERFAGGDRSTRAVERGLPEMRQMARRFNDMAHALDRERENQLTFLSSVAHDLRNPLSVLRLSTALATSEGAPAPAEQIRKTLGVIDRQIASLDRMVGDLLDATRIESGHLSLRLEQRDARTLAQEVVDLYGVSGSHSVGLAAPRAPVPIRCDPIRIEQVLNNLVSNAIKYSPAASPIDVEVRQEGSEAIFAVRDHGIGIASRDLARIFEPFRRMPGASHVAHGVGLGLSVSRRIVEAHAGRIEVESRPGRGSTFRVHLPIAGPD
jgi:signal transduction histidine kinase